MHFVNNNEAAQASQGEERIGKARLIGRALEIKVRRCTATIGQQLSMSPAHVRGVIDTATAMSD